ncbi:MAG: RluA family pseudouridine synthase [Clostridia bacterium]|nr:RluA family pseudouridine synthase [Clostridia bacterium]
MENKIIIADKSERLDVFLSEKLDKTRSAVKKLVDDGEITVNGNKVKAGRTLKIGEEISVNIPDPVKLDLEAENIPLDIIYQDKDIAIINKPQGMTVHAGNGTHGSTLVNALLYHLDSLSGINGVIRPGIVHRIDKDTSGLLVVAKNDAAHLSLSEQIKNKTCHRIYLALLEGTVKQNDGVIDTFIGRSDKNRTMMAVKDSGRRAVTHFKVLKRYKEFTFAEFKLETGRTHQIRVHCKYIGHPIVGDPVYGYEKQKFKLNGQLLHAWKLELTHPSTGERMSFEAPLPDYFQAVLQKLDKQ